MRNKATLILLEQAVVLVVFALSAVLCLRAFLWADETAKWLSARDQGLILAQNAAEILKDANGNLSRAAQIMGGEICGDEWVLTLDGGWDITMDEMEYTLRARQVDSGLPGLGQGRVTVYRQEGQLCQLEVFWQEVDGDE